MFAQVSPPVALDSTLVNPRLLLGVETAVIATLLLLLYIYRRQAYILWWMWGWVLLSAGAPDAWDLRDRDRRLPRLPQLRLVR